jgi:hypothetical protein
MIRGNARPPIDGAALATILAMVTIPVTAGREGSPLPEAACGLDPDQRIRQ